MKQSIFEVKANTKIAENTYKMVLGGDCSGITASGQFVNIKLDGFFLRRPISVCDYNDNELTLIYKVVGKGTEYMAELGAGEKLDILTGLGNGYDLSKSGNEPVLIGGGAGVPPMYNLCRKLVEFRRNVLVMCFLDSPFKRQNQRRQDRDTTEHTKNNALCHNDTQIPAKRKCHETHSQETCNRCDRTSCNRCEGIGNRLCHGSILILRRILPLLLVTVPEEDGIVSPWLPPAEAPHSAPS